MHTILHRYWFDRGLIRRVISVIAFGWEKYNVYHNWFVKTSRFSSIFNPKNIHHLIIIATSILWIYKKFFWYLAIFMLGMLSENLKDLFHISCFSAFHFPCSGFLFIRHHYSSQPAVQHFECGIIIFVWPRKTKGMF